MANDVVLGAAMRSNLLSLQNTQRSIDSTQLRLATGKKVNSALDNPQSFFQAQSLNNRASDLTRLLDGIGQSIRTIEEADKGITALTGLVEQASSVAESAQAEIRAAEGLVTITGTKDLRGVNLTADSGGAIATAGTNTFQISLQDKDVNGGAIVRGAAIAVEADDTVYDLVAKINSDATVTGTGDPMNELVRASVDSNGRLKIESLEQGATVRIGDATGGAANTLGSDGYSFLGLDNVVGSETLDGAVRQGGTAVSGRTLSSKAAADATKVNGEFVSSATLVAAGYMAAADVPTVNLNIDGEEGSFTLTTTGTIQEFVDKINSNSSINEKVTASFNTETGKIDLKFADGVGKATLTFGGAAGDAPAFGFGTGASDGTMTAADDTYSEAFTFIGSSANLEQYTKDFNKLREQIDGLVEDANYRGVNLLGGDTMTTFFNEDRSNTLETVGADLTTTGLGIDEADFIDAAAIEKAMGQVRDALDTVRAFGTSIANDLSIIQTRQDFTEQTINTLKAGASDLTDADLNEEGANLLALQTAQQLGVTSLSLASQSQQSVLRLF